MVPHLIVPVDESVESWCAFDIAVGLAERTGSDIRVVKVATDPAESRLTNERLIDEINDRGPFDVEVTVEVRLTADGVGNELATLVSLHPDAIVVMSSHGRGRSAAILGSVTEDLMRNTFGPIVLVGPHVQPRDFSGPIIVSVDGSPESEVALPLAAAWAAELDTTPWIVHVAPPTTSTSGDVGDVVETAYSARLAKDLAAFCGHGVEFDELHGRHPEREVPDYAARHDASMIVASSHGRSGLSRLTVGSVTAGFVRNATCPVTVVRLPHPTHADQPAHMWAY